MKIRNSFAILAFSAAFMLAGCGGGGNAPQNASTPGGASVPAVATKLAVTFETNGGSAVATQYIDKGGKATKPAEPTKAGFEFAYWCVDTYLTTEFDFNEALQTDTTLYAKWTPGGDSSSSAGGESTGGDSGDPSSSTPSGGAYYGPDGATLVSWYIVGEGKLFNGWQNGTMLQLYSNPGNAEDKGCLLNVEFAVGDVFKVTDLGKTWFGYEGVDPSDDPKNAGKTCFSGVSDGYVGQNFHCDVAGFYDVYINKTGVFWIQVHEA